MSKAESTLDEFEPNPQGASAAACWRAFRAAAGIFGGQAPSRLPVDFPGSLAAVQAAVEAANAGLDFLAAPISIEMNGLDNADIRYGSGRTEATLSIWGEIYEVGVRVEGCVFTSAGGLRSAASSLELRWGAALREIEAVDGDYVHFLAPDGSCGTCRKADVPSGAKMSPFGGTPPWKDVQEEAT